MTSEGLADLLRAAVAGDFPAPDGEVELVAEPVGRAHAVVAFSAHFVVCAPVDEPWLAQHLPDQSYTASHAPAFLLALARRLDADIGALDAVLAADGPIEEGRAVDLDQVDDRDHTRVRRALRYRDDVEVWRTPDERGHLVLGRGLAGRLEASFEVAPAARGHGLGAALASAARRRATPDDPVFVQVSPGNVASLRALLAAGYRPVCSEVLLPPASPGTLL